MGFKAGDAITAADLKANILSTFINSSGAADGGTQSTNVNDASYRTQNCIFHTNSGVANTPNNDWATIVNMVPDSNGWAIQLAYSWNYSSFYIRGYYHNTSSWTDWLLCAGSGTNVAQQTIQNNTFPQLTLKRTNSGETSMYYRNNTYIWATGINVWSIGDNAWGVGGGTDSSSALKMKVQSNGYCVSSGWSTSSSRLIKTNISTMTLQDAQKVLQLHPVNFDFKQGFGPKNQSGLIAEEAELIIPNIVQTPEDYDEKKFDEKKGNGQPLKSIDYSKMVPYLIKLAQVQNEQIISLQQRVTNLENKLKEKE